MQSRLCIMSHASCFMHDLTCIAYVKQQTYIIHAASGMMNDARCIKKDAMMLWCHEAWCRMHDTRRMTYDAWCVMRDALRIMRHARSHFLGHRAHVPTMFRRMSIVHPWTLAQGHVDNSYASWPYTKKNTSQKKKTRNTARAIHTYVNRCICIYIYIYYDIDY